MIEKQHDLLKKSIGVLVTEDDPAGGGPEGVFELIQNRFNDTARGTIQLTPYFVCQNKFPGRIDDHNGYLITGAHYNVNEGLTWMNRLEQLIVQIAEGNLEIFLFGICFGHQIIARTLGGRVDVNPSRRFIWGRDKIKVAPELAEMSFYKEASLGPSHLYMMQSHYDQVIEVPATARVLGGCEECPYEILMYAGNNILTVQGHPELTKEWMTEKLTKHVDNGNISRSEAEKVKPSLEENGEGDKLMKMIVAFFFGK